MAAVVAAATSSRSSRTTAVQASSRSRQLFTGTRLLGKGVSPSKIALSHSQARSSTGMARASPPRDRSSAVMASIS
jgi:hypothetical protein